ncbi:hypothetical protein V144x_31380 [Gimesia aquarii]|uniref:Uncharacterized protein n=1 Tax=Gimesia aquarii TaxID=2527964 RepID=A0A517VXD2_9PLAN|nr:hypothetical protein V144x_31380 [Gimesia aquarii]
MQNELNPVRNSMSLILHHLDFQFNLKNAKEFGM